MVIYLILIFILFIILRHKNQRSYIDNTCFVERGILNAQECEHIIDIATKYKFRQDVTCIDGKPKYQIDIFGDGIENEELWKICKNIYDSKLKKILNREKWIPLHKRNLDFVFLKKYTPDERSYVPLHLDDNYLTMSFLISDTRNFKGGELYVFDIHESNTIFEIDKTTDITIDIRNNFINNHKNLPILNYNQGDVTVYTGGIHMHGTLPVTHGERYVLTYFFK